MVRYSIRVLHIRVSIEECCARNRYQGQGQVITSSRYCGISLFVPATDTSFGNNTPELYDNIVKWNKIKHNCFEMSRFYFLKSIVGSAIMCIAVAFPQTSSGGARELSLWWNIHVLIHHGWVGQYRPESVLSFDVKMSFCHNKFYFGNKKIVISFILTIGFHLLLRRHR